MNAAIVAEKVVALMRPLTLVIMASVYLKLAPYSAPMSALERNTTRVLMAAITKGAVQHLKSSSSTADFWLN